MDVIVGHENLDFDALGSMVLARYLHPGARMVRVGGLEGRVREVTELFADHLAMLDEDEVALEEVTRVVVCDTARAERIGPFKALVGKVPFVVYDHHPRAPGDLPASGGAVRPFGATVTVIAEILRARGLRPHPGDATLAYAGLWEDTGGFTYPGTTATDLEAGAWLVELGAGLNAVRDWVRSHPDSTARAMLAELMQRVRVVERSGLRVALTWGAHEGYVPALAPLAHTLMDLYEVDAVFMVLRLDEQTLVIARSRGRLDVGRFLGERFGGGGHARAAFARVDDEPERILARLEEGIEAYLAPEPLLGTLMTRPVQTVPASLSAEEALVRMRELGYGGLPVVDEAGRVVGVVRRRDLERAVRYGMGSGAVKSFATVARTLPEDAPLSEARRALKEGAGRVLVLDASGKPKGIFTRTDLYRLPTAEQEAAEDRIRASLPEGVREVIEALAETYREGAIYLVGGAVRDALLGEASPDVDLVLEGLDPAEVARFLVRRFGGSYGVHVAFGTAHARLATGVEVDLAIAREEEYPRPGALPKVRPSTLSRDLARRDFTVNAMAFRILPEPNVLIDLYGGLQDLRMRVLRPLHPLSFIEDPSRVLRGLRLAARLGFALHPEAERQIEELLKRPLDEAAAGRLRRELMLALAEPRPLRVLRLAERYGLLEGLYGLRVTPGLWSALERLEAFKPERSVPQEAYLYLLLLAAPDPEAFLRRFGWPQRYLQHLRLLREPPDRPEAVREAGEALTLAFAALHPDRAEWVQKPTRQLRGRDLIELGMKPGPAVGKILREVEAARARGEVRGYEEELTLARKLMSEYGTSRLP